MMEKIILFLLTAALFMSSVCGGASDEVQTTATDEPHDESTTEAAPDEISDDLGNYDFGGKTFSIYTRTASIFYPYLDRQETSGDLVSDAVYARNRKIEGRFKFRLAEAYYDWSSADGNDSPRKLLLAGDDTYQAIQGRNVNMFNYASEGFLYSVDALGAIDPDNPYWNAQLYSDFSLCGEHYFAVGDFNL